MSECEFEVIHGPHDRESFSIKNDIGRERRAIIRGRIEVLPGIIISGKHRPKVADPVVLTVTGPLAKKVLVGEGVTTIITVCTDPPIFVRVRHRTVSGGPAWRKISEGNLPRG